MNRFCIVFFSGALLARTSVSAQVAADSNFRKRVGVDTGHKIMSLKRLPFTDTAGKRPVASLRLPPVPVGEARYNAQYKAYQQRQLSGVRDPLSPNTYVPPPQEKPKLFSKKPKHSPKLPF